MGSVHGPVMAVFCSKLDLGKRIAAVRHFYEAKKNTAEASRRLALEFNCYPVQGRNIKAIVDKFNRTGSVEDDNKARTGRKRSATSDGKGEELGASLIRSPQNSLRRLSLDLEISNSSVERLMHKRNLKPFIPRLFHVLHDGDDDRRMEFSETLLEMVSKNSDLLDNIWWSDEACFKLNGHINRHNCVYWATENPRIMVEK